MDERDFLDALRAGRFPSRDASAFFSELRKSAGVKELAGRAASKGVEIVSKNKAPLAGAALGGLAATGAQYLANKSGKQRQMAETSLASHEKSMAETKAKGKEPGFPSKMNHARLKATADVAHISEKHPVRGALLAAPVGAMAGYGLGAAARKLLG